MPASTKNRGGTCEKSPEKADFVGFFTKSASHANFAASAGDIVASGDG